jgi:hypothetical protein
MLASGKMSSSIIVISVQKVSECDSIAFFRPS